MTAHVLEISYKTVGFLWGKILSWCHLYEKVNTNHNFVTISTFLVMIKMTRIAIYAELSRSLFLIFIVNFLSPCKMEHQISLELFKNHNNISQYDFIFKRYLSLNKKNWLLIFFCLIDSVPMRVNNDVAWEMQFKCKHLFKDFMQKRFYCNTFWR